MYSTSYENNSQGTFIYIRGMHIFQKIYEPPQNFRCQKVNMQKVPHREPMSIRMHNTKFKMGKHGAHNLCIPNIHEFLKIMDIKNTQFIKIQTQIPQQRLTAPNTFLHSEASESSLPTTHSAITLWA